MEERTDGLCAILSLRVLVGLLATPVGGRPDRGDEAIAVTVR